MNNKRVQIDWKYSGKPDGFFGTDATTAERALVWIIGLLGTAMLGWVWWLTFDWVWWRYALAALITLDVIGGVVANSLNSCKRFYHSAIKPEETGFTGFAKNHFAFTAMHIHPIIVGLVFGNMFWGYAIFWYLALLASSMVVLSAPLYLQRPLSMGIITLAILINIYLIQSVNGFEWFIPALFLKIVYGHIVREEPYRG